MPVEGCHPMSDPKNEPPSGPVPLAAASRVNFEIGTAPGCVVLTLEDGSVLQVHPIVLDVGRLPGTNELGEPLYSVQAGLAVRLMKQATVAPILTEKH
jgi:hypothetical protein